MVLYLNHGNTRTIQAANQTFLSRPLPVPDGKGIVGLTRLSEGVGLTYVPLELPLADVVNAWMFLESPEDSELFSKHSGLFRNLTDDQLYPLYESEAYYCQRYDPQTPTRPYLVTTDIFWELFASAYEGMFILKERKDAFPAFWSFVEAAESSLRSSHPEGMWRQVFSTMKKLRSEDGSPDPELAMILKAGGRSLSPVLQSELNYGDLKPRGHYADDEESSNYFRAVHYLIKVSILARDSRDLKELEELPSEVASRALAWICSYEGFIAPSSAPLVWQKGGFNPPPYARHLETKARTFPLSWEFDNQVLLSTVYHRDWPSEERIEGPGAKRLLPSGLDLAAALGSKLSYTILGEELKKYPNLKRVLDELQVRFKAQAVHREGDPSLYRLWLNTLGAQWAEEVHRSTIDGENGLRPYVYALGPHGLMAKWRGSALAWPLLDAVILPRYEPVVCALHWGDSFIMLNPQTTSTRVAAYRWNGFGFAGLNDPEAVGLCRDLLERLIFGHKAY